MGYYFVVARCSLSISARHKRLSAIMPAAIPDAAEYTLKTNIMIAIKSDTALCLNMGYYFVVARCSLSISARHKRLSAIMPAAIPDAAEYTLKTNIMIAIKSDTAQTSRHILR